MALSEITKERMSQAALRRPRSHYEKISAKLRRDPNECFDARIEIDTVSGCHLWQGPLNERGYGLFTYRVDVAKRRTKAAHRFAWERVHGPVPEGLELDHLCRVRRCVNESHLEAVTHIENVRRGKLGEVTRRRNLARRAY